MRYYTFEIVVEKEPEDEGYSAYSPTMPGCFSNGRTIEEAKRNIREAIQVHLGFAARTWRRGAAERASRARRRTHRRRSLMVRMPQVTAAALVRFLKSQGFVEDRQQGSHLDFAPY